MSYKHHKPDTYKNHVISRAELTSTGDCYHVKGQLIDAYTQTYIEALDLVDAAYKDAERKGIGICHSS